MFSPELAYAMGQLGGAGGQGGNPIAAFMPLVIMFVIFYFLLIRPQQKKAKEHRQTLQNLKKGDFVLTNGGLYGCITNLDDEVITIDLGKDNTVKVNRSFISDLATKDQAKKIKK